MTAKDINEITQTADAATTVASAINPIPAAQAEATGVVATPAAGSPVTASAATNVTDLSNAAEHKDKIRVRLPVSVEYEGETLDQLWMRRPVVLDGVVASNQTGTSSILLALVAQCVGVDVDWLWEQKASVTSKLLKVYSEELKDPMHVSEWDNLTLTLFKPLTIKGKLVSSVTVTEPTTRDLMDDTSKEKMYDLVARLVGFQISELREMDYQHDFSKLVEKVNSFRDA